ncbi:Hsp70 family protein [uncultured Corynebacterium sp.]|uniref:Hsp70 family protein n=1 Tax=uncultured Corynebacterium sp. TaxID=159447 RepID=UPI0025CFAC14|nr:Hsp70 family protein [uncultured Corynebacterium sp.]
MVSTPNDSTWHFAIDFGTSNTAAAHTSPATGMVEALALTHRSNLMPSAVYLDDSSASHSSEISLLTGDAALAKTRRDASRLLLSPKRYIDHEMVQVAGENLPIHEVVGTVIGTALRVGMKQHAEKEPTSVTLTHPEAWSPHAIEQLINAAESIGVERGKIRTLSEPRAAAIHYASQNQISNDGHVVVFDFGGGTLDIAVLQALSDGNFRVTAAKGDNSIGGRTVDNLLYRWALQQIEQDDPDLADSLQTAPASVTHTLQDNIREAKEMLSDTTNATIAVSTPEGETELLITREEFNEVIRPSIDRAIDLTRAAMDQAGVQAEETPIFMTGGSSRIPYVQNRLSEIGLVMTLDDPKTVVCRGALSATLFGFTGEEVPHTAEFRAQNGANGSHPFTAAAGAVGGVGAGSAMGYSTDEPAPSNPFGSSTNPSMNAYGSSTQRASSNAYGSSASANNASGYGDSYSDPGQQNQGRSPYGVASYGQESSSSMAYGYGGANTNAPASRASAVTQLLTRNKKVTSAALAALLVLAGGFFVVNKLTASPNGLDKFSEATTIPDQAAPEDSESYKALTILAPEVKGVMPTQFYNRINSCDTDKVDSSYNSSSSDKLPAEMWKCRFLDNQVSKDLKESTGYSYTYVATGDDAEKIYQWYQENSNFQKNMIQEAGNGWAEVQYLSPNSNSSSSSGNESLFYYPKEKQLVVTSYSSYARDNSIKEWARYLGFMPQEDKK